MRMQQPKRRAVTTVEAAAVYPFTFLCLFGLIIGAMGIFRYQEVATLSRETARYAAVHGKLYAKDAGVTAPTPEQLYQTVILQRAVALDPSKITYSITYNTSNNPTRTAIVSGEVQHIYNVVTVAVTYRWIPEGFL